ncbi:MAG: N-acetyl-gamma-glutamyl-phosphate reductase [Lentisphaerae bacterium GWF2_52_8]|nr:MAG: N-acetyl-gamma-glutamyl-phosphate reductase [Lentisphaerae bacterium GWF2_52_8]
MSPGKNLRVAVLGASGYSGEELLRILLRHRYCSISAITSRQHAGQPVGDVFPRFSGLPLSFCVPDAAALASACDVAFLALPHGVAAEFALPLLKAGVKVIDISADFRLKSPAKYKEYYKEEHPAPSLLETAVYGLPERYREKIRAAQLIACPGCYPTSIILPSAPLLASGLLSPKGIIVASMSGVSGAGRKVELPYIFPECNESVRAYAPCGHRHLPEIEQELAVAAGLSELAINFVPHLVPVNRGINSTIFLKPKEEGFSTEKALEILSAAYAKEKFVRVLAKGKLADTKCVTMTNTCEIGASFDKHTGNLVLTSAIDNLTKGASGQAIQCMNIIFGFDESEGLL